MVERNTIVQASSLLAMVGSALVCLTTMLPHENRKKTGKILLFWLSISDFFSAFTYFSQSLAGYSDDSDFCKATSLLGIFFPVASFLWTDIVALYLYWVIVRRNEFVSDPWSGNLRYCHYFVWSICLLIITVVGSFGHAGKQGPDSTDWCWIVADKKDLFLWQLIGGKLIEWVSAFIILPYFYAAAAFKLVQLEQSDYTALLDHSHASPHSKSPSLAAKSKFSAFYAKMTAVPILFFLARFWGSLSVVVQAADTEREPTRWLQFMQDAFDPSQGTFNALVFVVFSQDGRISVRVALGYVLQYFSVCLPSSWKPTLDKLVLTSSRVKIEQLDASAISGAPHARNGLDFMASEDQQQSDYASYIDRHGDGISSSSSSHSLLEQSENSRAIVFD